MEESQALSINESFSNDWLMNMKKSAKFIESPSDSLRFSLDLEADHSKASKKCTERSSFHFDLSGSEPVDMSVADQMIRNGSLVPLNLVNQRNIERMNSIIPENSVLFEPPSIEGSKSFRTQYREIDAKYPITLHSSPMCSPVNISRSSSDNRKVLRAAKHKLRSFERASKPPKRIVILNFFRSLLHFCNKSKDVGIDEAHNASPRVSNDTSCRTTSGCSSPFYDPGRERAIREAILYCKTSSRKYMDGSFAVYEDEAANK